MATVDLKTTKKIVITLDESEAKLLMCAITCVAEDIDACAQGDSILGKLSEKYSEDEVEKLCNGLYRFMAEGVGEL